MGMKLIRTPRRMVDLVKEDADICYIRITLKRVRASAVGQMAFSDVMEYITKGKFYEYTGREWGIPKIKS